MCVCVCSVSIRVQVFSVRSACIYVVVEMNAKDENKKKM